MTRHTERLEYKLMHDAEFRAAYERERRDLQQRTCGNTTVWTQGDLNKASVPTPKEKIKIEKLDAEHTLKAEVRDLVCWSYGCKRVAVRWVREVQFDIKGPKVEANQSIINTRDYGGPIPGFCNGHDAVGPKELAETVYHDREEFKFGAPANRWFVIFTDGTKMGGDINALNLGPGYEVKEEYTPGADH